MDVLYLPGDMGRLELGEGVYGMGLDTVLARRPCADISLKYLQKNKNPTQMIPLKMHL